MTEVFLGVADTSLLVNESFLDVADTMPIWSKGMPVGKRLMLNASQSSAHSKLSVQQLYQRLNTTEAEISRFCEKWQVTELAVFGSALRTDFRREGTDPSDVDLLYVSAPEARYGFQFFDMCDELAQLLGREVDLVSKRGIERSRNFLRRRAILESAQVIYETRSAVDS